MSILWPIGIVWAAAIAGIKLMRKVQPENKIYPAWVAFVVVVFTCFVLWYTFC